MIDSVQMHGKLNVTGMDFEGISLELPLRLHVVDIQYMQTRIIAGDLLM